MTTEAPALDARSDAGLGHFVPPVPPSEMNFAAWLAERTATRAATLRLLVPGTDAVLHLPRIRPAVSPPPARHRRRRRGSAAAVHAAYLADVGGLSPRRLVESGLFDFPSERSARHHVRDGRHIAADLGAWPWAVIDGKPLPRNWWADRDFALALQKWAMGDLRPPEVSPTVRELRPRRFTAAARLPTA